MKLFFEAQPNQSAELETDNVDAIIQMLEILLVSVRAHGTKSIEKLGDVLLKKKERGELSEHWKITTK